jgi:hypothetical protein
MQRLKRNCSNRRFAQTLTLWRPICNRSVGPIENRPPRGFAAKRTPILRILVRQLLIATELSKNRAVPAKRKSHSRRHPGSGNRENVRVGKELRGAHAWPAFPPPQLRPTGPRRRADDVNGLTVRNVQTATGAVGIKHRRPIRLRFRSADQRAGVFPVQHLAALAALIGPPPGPAQQEESKSHRLPPFWFAFLHSCLDGRENAMEPNSDCDRLRRHRMAPADQENYSMPADDTTGFIEKDSAI